MLHWYATLIELRKKYVTGGSRTCRAELREGVLEMQVPAEEPVLRVFARLEGSAALPELHGGWERLLSEEADGYAVAVWAEAADTR
jgi:hypothetical protein